MIYILVNKKVFNIIITENVENWSLKNSSIIDNSRAVSAGGKNLEALAMDNGRSALVILLLGDPHLLEGRQRGQDGATDPYRVLSLGGSDDLDLDGGGSQSGDFLLHTVSNTRVHGGATGHDGVGVQVLTDVNIALHDGVEGGLVDAAGLHSEEGRLEE